MLPVSKYWTSLWLTGAPRWPLRPRVLTVNVNGTARPCHEEDLEDGRQRLALLSRGKSWVLILAKTLTFSSFFPSWDLNIFLMLVIFLHHLVGGGHELENPPKKMSPPLPLAKNSGVLLCTQQMYKMYLWVGPKIRVSGKITTCDHVLIQNVDSTCQTWLFCVWNQLAH